MLHKSNINLNHKLSFLKYFGLYSGHFEYEINLQKHVRL